MLFHPLPLTGGYWMGGVGESRNGFETHLHMCSSLAPFEGDQIGSGEMVSRIILYSAHNRIGQREDNISS
jgi:hypothetical protein